MNINQPDGVIQFHEKSVRTWQYVRTTRHLTVLTFRKFQRHHRTSWSVSWEFGRSKWQRWSISILAILMSSFWPENSETSDSTTWGRLNKQGEQSVAFGSKSQKKNPKNWVFEADIELVELALPFSSFFRYKKNAVLHKKKSSRMEKTHQHQRIGWRMKGKSWNHHGISRGNASFLPLNCLINHPIDKCHQLLCPKNGRMSSIFSRKRWPHVTKWKWFKIWRHR